MEIAIPGALSESPLYLLPQHPVSFLAQTEIIVLYLFYHLLSAMY